MSESWSKKPLDRKAYGHIPHLPESRMGPGDHRVHEGQSRICQTKARDKHDRIIVQEKLDGSCCAVARIDSELVALGRAGYRAFSSPHEQHQMFAKWVAVHDDKFGYLGDGHRVVGEWLAQAHGTKYDLHHEPFVPFDIMTGPDRLPFDKTVRLIGTTLVMPRLIHDGGPISVESVRPFLEGSGHGALDPVEGAVWRVERRGKVDFLAKWVRHDKVDGCYLPEISGEKNVWNWRPPS